MHRSAFLFLTAILASLSVLGTAARGEDPPGRPNILLLLADDLGWADVGFLNPATFYETPNIDRIAAAGMHFPRAYAAAPVCSPTRASLLTGCHPARMATTDWFGAPQPGPVLEAGRRGEIGRFQKLPLLPAPYVDRLPAERETLAETLRDAGYATFFAGKWHLGGAGSSPRDHGFDESVAGDHRGGPYGRGRYFHPFDLPGLASEPGDHLPARLAEETVRFLERQRARPGAHASGVTRENTARRPWFAMLSFYSVHTPLLGREELVAKYERKRERLGLEPAWGEEGERRNRLVQEHAVYAAMVEAMDEAVGTVLDAVEASGQAEDTIVVFFSDNGGLSTSEGHPTSNLPLRAGKGWLYEGGIRVPCAVRWPGRVAPGSSHLGAIASTDLAPTLLAAAGLGVPAEQYLDGTDLSRVLLGRERADSAGPTESRELFWHYPHWGNQGGSPGAAILRGDWKLIESFVEGRGPELYHLENDIGETMNLAERDPRRTAALLERLRAWQRGVGARMPKKNPLMAVPGR